LLKVGYLMKFVKEFHPKKRFQQMLKMKIGKR